MCLLQGAHGHSPLLQKLAFGNYLARVENPKTPHDWISRDRDVVRRYAADPKCTFTFTNSAMGELTRTLRQVYAMLQKAGLTDLTLTLYPGGRHEMLNEINREQVYADVLAWCYPASESIAGNQSKTVGRRKMPAVRINQRKCSLRLCRSPARRTVGGESKKRC